jgi:Protein of unknown function (DUF2934)
MPHPGLYAYSSTTNERWNVRRYIPEPCEEVMSKAKAIPSVADRVPSEQRQPKTKSVKSITPTQHPTSTATVPGDTPVPGEDVELKEREQMIRQSAYERYLQRQGAPGNPVDDWLAAEAEIDQPGPQTNGKREKP